MSPDQSAIGAVPAFDMTSCVILLRTSTMTCFFISPAEILIAITKYLVRNFANSKEQPSLLRRVLNAVSAVWTFKINSLRTLQFVEKNNQCWAILTDPC